VMFFALLATLSFWLVYLKSEGQPYLAAFVVLFAAVAAAPFWGVRPQTVSLALTSAFLYLLGRYRRTNNWKILLWLLPLMLIWANSHGSFALAPLLILVYLIGEIAERLVSWNADHTPPPPRAIPLLGILLGCIALIVVNPNRVALYPYPFQTLASGTIQTYIQEWLPPELFSAPVLPFTLMLGATLGALAAARRRMDLTCILLLVVFTFASLRAARQISIWVLIAAPVLATALVSLRDLFPALERFSAAQTPTRRQRILNALILVIFALAVLLRVVTVIQTKGSQNANIFLSPRWTGLSVNSSVVQFSTCTTGAAI
jgi:hypothetical protein